MRSKLIKIFMFVFIINSLPMLIKADEKIYAPNNWDCFFEGTTLRCKSSATDYVELTKGTGNVYCSAGYKTCWDYKTGFSWYWTGNSSSIIFNPKLTDEETYDLRFEDLEEKFQKYPSHYYESNWELQTNGTIVGIWDYETSAGSNKSCPKKFGVVGDLDEGRCYYSIYVDYYNGSKCKQISGIEGKPQTFLGKKYCIYNLFGYEKNDCSKESYYGAKGNYLSNYESCIGVPSTSSTNPPSNEDDTIRCVDSNGKSKEPVFYNAGSSENAKDYYYFCSISDEIMGNTDVCLESKFLNEAEVIEKFGQANKGNHALYCKTTVVNGVPPQEDPKPTPTTPGDDKIETNVSFWGNLPTIKCGDMTIPEPIPPITRTIVILLKIAAPLILIVMGMFDILKAVMASDEKKLKESQNMFVKRLIPAVVIFLVVTILQLVIGIFADSQEEAKSLIKCIDCMVSDSSKCG